MGLTHFKDGQISFTISPVYFKINTVADSEKAKITGKDLKGYGVGFTFAYALSNRLFLDVNYAYSTLSGDMLVSFPKDGINNDVYLINANNKSQFIKLGLGFDLIKSARWSMPIIVGGYRKYIDAKITTNEYNNSGYIVEDQFMNGSGSGVINGIAATVVISYKWEPIKISPYITYYNDFDELMIDEYHLHTPMMNGEDNPSSLMPGLSIAYISDSSFEFSFSISGILFTKTNYYNDRFLMGLETQNYMFSITYKNI